MSDVETLVERIDALVSRYYHHADEGTRAVITNLTGIHRLMADLIVAQAREREHWAVEARNATDALTDVRAELADTDLIADGVTAELRETLRLLDAANTENARLQAVVEEFEAHRCEGAS